MWLYGELQPVHVPLFSEVTFWLFVYFNRHFTRSSPKKKNAREYKGKNRPSLSLLESVCLFFQTAAWQAGVIRCVGLHFFCIRQLLCVDMLNYNLWALNLSLLLRVNLFKGFFFPLFPLLKHISTAEGVWHWFPFWKLSNPRGKSKRGSMVYRPKWCIQRKNNKQIKTWDFKYAGSVSCWWCSLGYVQHLKT